MPTLTRSSLVIYSGTYGISDLIFTLSARVALNAILARLYSRHFSFGLPPLPEQHRIVEAIETQFTRLDAAVAALERVKANLKRYRASVLKAACEGRLVPTEADLARAEGRDYEPADVLLKRILVERRAKWEADELAKMIAKGKPPKDDRWKAKYKEPQPPDTTELPDLPEGWRWASIEQVSSLVTDGDHNPPKRVEHGVPHLTAKHVKRLDRLTTESCTFISDADFREIPRQRYEPAANDLIVTCVGTVGEIANSAARVRLQRRPKTSQLFCRAHRGLDVKVP